MQESSATWSDGLDLPEVLVQVLHTQVFQPALHEERDEFTTAWLSRVGTVSDWALVVEAASDELRFPRFWHALERVQRGDDVRAILTEYGEARALSRACSRARFVVLHHQVGPAILQAGPQSYEVLAALRSMYEARESHP